MSLDVRVFLVGAGPGDADLLTLKAVKAIARADVLLVDDLVNDAVLAHARADARVVYVGKRGGCASTPQAFINKLIVAQAQQGHVVVRLKGGDPAVFGRAAEEIEALHAAELAYEIVPGITAASAAAAALGTPLTDRFAGHGVAFVTGHAASDASPVNWQALLDAKLTLAIYMGVGRAVHIVNDLLRAGAQPGTPCAVVSHASTAVERRYACALGEVAELIATQSVASPAVLLIGDALRNVASARERSICTYGATSSQPHMPALATS
jgi:uroporphyrin-III C-methyltransferase